MKGFNAVVRMATVGVLMTIAGAAIAQQNYPNKPIRFITPYPPGGSTTVLARLVGQKLTESWGQQVIVDNRGGGNTIIGTEALVKSPPDGHTIFLASPLLVILPHLYHALPYDTLRDVAPVATLASTELILVLNPSVPANNLQELIALAKSMPGQLNYASSSSGGPTHLAGEMFNIMAGVKTQHVPYKGGGPALTDLLGGQVQMYFNTPVSFISHIKSGKLKAIAISGEMRLSTFPQVPTFTQAGLAGFDVGYWQGILVPAGTPKAIIDKLSAELSRIVALPDIKAKLDSQGFAPFISTPAQFAVLLKSDMAKYAKVIKTANIKIE